MHALPSAPAARTTPAAAGGAALVAAHPGHHAVDLEVAAGVVGQALAGRGSCARSSRSACTPCARRTAGAGGRASRCARRPSAAGSPLELLAVLVDGDLTRPLAGSLDVGGELGRRHPSGWCRRGRASRTPASTAGPVGLLLREVSITATSIFSRAQPPSRRGPRAPRAAATGAAGAERGDARGVAIELVARRRPPSSRTLLAPASWARCMPRLAASACRRTSSKSLPSGPVGATSARRPPATPSAGTRLTAARRSEDARVLQRCLQRRDLGGERVVRRGRRRRSRVPRRPCGRRDGEDAHACMCGAPRRQTPSSRTWWIGRSRRAGTMEADLCADTCSVRQRCSPPSP